MSDRLVIRRSDPIVIADDDHGTLEVRLVPWDTVARVNDYGAEYEESWLPGSLTPADRVIAYDQHQSGPAGVERGSPIGRVDNIRATADGLYGDIVLSGSRLANDVRANVNCFGGHVSIEALVPEDEIGSDVVRSSGVLTGVALVLPPNQPAYQTAEILAVRSQPMTETLSSDTVPSPVLDAPPEPAAPHMEVSRAVITEEVARQVSGLSVGRTAVTHPLARYDRFVDAFDDAFRSKDSELSMLIGRALADQISPNNPGVIPPGWVNDVKGIVDHGTPTISALGPNPDTGEGIELSWPFFDGNLLALVGVQAAEKTPITSVRVDLLKGTAPLAVYAGGSDVSLVLINRSSPAYRDAYLRIMAAAYAAVTDKAATDQLEVASNAGLTYDVATDTDGSAFRAAVFSASVMVRSATGSPADVVLAATDVFTKVGSVMTPPPVVNVGGTASASSLSVDVSQLSVIEAPALAPGSAIVTNKQSAAWASDGPRTVQAFDVEKLGENIAVWGMGGLVTYFPTGVVTLNATGTPAATAAKKGK